MIRRAAFSNFKSLRAVTCEFERFTVIVGANASGKTSILDGLQYLALSTRDRLGRLLTADSLPPELRSRGASGDMRLELRGDFDGNEAGVDLRVAFSERVDEEEKLAWHSTVTLEWAGQQQTSAQRGPERPTVFEEPIARKLYSALRPRKLRLDPQKLAMPSYNDRPGETPLLAIDGDGLAAVLLDMKAREPDVFDEIQEAACRVVPSLQRIRLRPAKVVRATTQHIQINESEFDHPVEQLYSGHQLLLDFKGAPSIPAPLASDGTLLTIGVLTALCAKPQPRLLLLDDIDEALHPRAQKELVAQLRQVLERRSELQIIATSHSPYLLDCFAPTEVLLTAARPDGSTACAKLSEHPDIGRWKDIAKAGELWSFVGEDWVAEQVEAAPAA
jgi:predicted ATPase